MDNLIKFNPFFIKPTTLMDSNTKYNYIDQPMMDQYLEMTESYFMFCSMYIHAMRAFYKNYCVINNL
jgi:hypothetical protein